MKSISKKHSRALALAMVAILACCALGIRPAHAVITDFTPEGIREFLNANPDVASSDKFLQNLPVDFHYNWIMMTDSESAQTGTATSPRFLLFDLEATRVFGVALDSETIEYLHFEAPKNKFRFHEIGLKAGGGTINIDKPRCLECHASTRAGVKGSRPRPNWDAYDSWGGALPFNGDRIYKDSEEEKAVKRILNDIKGKPFVMQLGFPPGIQDNVTAGTVTIDYTSCDPGIDTTDDPCKTDVGNGKVFLRVESQSPGKGTKTDEGRGVALFDFFTKYNALRVAQELADFPIDPVDIRPVALAIAKHCVEAKTLGKYAPKDALTKLLAHHTNLDGNIKNFPDLLADTLKRMHSLPKLKADFEIENLKGLIMANGSAADPKKEVALRSNKLSGALGAAGSCSDLAAASFKQFARGF